ncbi:MAG: hypothetical protein QXP27_05840 [Candidatus Methanomethyliaceae archaeon]
MEKGKPWPRAYPERAKQIVTNSWTTGQFQIAADRAQDHRRENGNALARIPQALQDGLWERGSHSLTVVGQQDVVEIDLARGIDVLAELVERLI